MNMGLLEWSILIGFMAFLVYIAIGTKKYSNSVADFMSANRCAGRYLVGTAMTEATFGAITVVAGFEMFYQAGFSIQFWATVGLPLGMILSLSGFVYYRYRQTRAMTMGQFLEMRYSRKFRIFAGILCWTAGVINFGIFPQVAARFFINFCALPPEVPVFGMSIPIFPLMLVILIGLALFFTFIGGQITVLVTDFWQGLFATVVFALIAGFIWFKFPWTELKEGLLFVSGPGKSLIDPLQIQDKPDFGPIYFILIWFFAVYHRGAWQGLQGYYTSATNAHEAKMAPIVGALRVRVIALGLLMIPLAAITILHHPKYAAMAAEVNSQLQATYPGQGVLQRQMLMTITMTHFLPPILIGLFATAMLGFFISTNNSYMHSWGTVLVQDVIYPFRKKPFELKQHLKYLKISIFGVAVFIFFFSLFFPMQDYINMFYQITGAIYLGGAGSVIIGGLYWKRGTTSAAWAAMTVGSILALTSIILQSTWQHFPMLVAWRPEFPINGQVAGFWCGIAGILTYVSISLLGPKKVADMDKILHRGKYAIKEEEDALVERGAKGKPINRFWKMIGVNSHEFSNVDKGLFIYRVSATICGLTSFAVLLFLHAIGFMNNHRWLFFWRITIYLLLIIGAIGGIWVSIGGMFDLRKMYKKLSSKKINTLDDGRVSGQHSLADEAAEEI